MLGNMMHAMVFFESKDNFHYLEIMKTFYCFTSQKSMNKKVALITFFYLPEIGENYPDLNVLW